MRDRYLTVAGEGVYETVVNRSRFVCAVRPAVTVEDAVALVEHARRRHPAATHHCYAYVLGADARVHKSSDDGEPGGTAGVPMLQVLLGREVRDVAVVVSRYFGGVKLGAGGLARAYGGAVGGALDVVGVEWCVRLFAVVVSVDYALVGRVEHVLRGAGCVPREVTYGARVSLRIALPVTEVEDFRVWLAGVTAGAADVDVVGEMFGRSPGGGVSVPSPRHPWSRP